MGPSRSCRALYAILLCHRFGLLAIEERNTWVVVACNDALEDLLGILDAAARVVDKLDHQVRSNILPIVAVVVEGQPWVSSPGPKAIGSAPRW